MVHLIRTMLGKLKAKAQTELGAARLNTVIVLFVTLIELFEDAGVHDIPLDAAASVNLGRARKIHFSFRSHPLWLIIIGVECQAVVTVLNFK